MTFSVAAPLFSITSLNCENKILTALKKLTLMIITVHRQNQRWIFSIHKAARIITEINLEIGIED
jgi:hypothetical protein